MSEKVLEEIYTLTMTYCNRQTIVKKNVNALFIRHGAKRFPGKWIRPTSINVTPVPCDAIREYLEITLIKSLNPCEKGTVTFGEQSE